MNAVTFPVATAAASPQSEAREKALGLRALRYFLSVAQSGNVGRAARDLNVSQPAISLQLRKLEAGLGTQLLLRHGRGVTLTPAGTRLRDRLQTVMHLLASPLDEVEAEPPASRVTFAVPTELGAPLVGPLATAIRSRWPEVTLDVREGSGADLEEWLLNRQVDLAVLQDPPALPDIEIAPVLIERLGVVVPARSPLADTIRPLSLRDLVDESLVLPGRQHWIRRRLERAAQQAGIRLNPAMQVSSSALAKLMVRNGFGCTVLPRSCVQDEIDRGALAFRPLAYPSLASTQAIAFHRAASNSLVPVFAEVARNMVVALAADGAWPDAQVVPCSPGTLPLLHGHPAPVAVGELCDSIAE